MPNSVTPAAREPADSLKRTLLRGFAGVGATRVAQMIMSLLVSVVLARILGADNFGRYTFVVAVAGLCALPAYAGLAPLLVREVARYDSRSGNAKWAFIASLWGWSFRLALVLGCVGAVVGAVYFAFEYSALEQFGGGQAEHYPKAGGVALVACALALIVLSTALGRTGAALLQGMRRVVVATLPETTVRPAVLLLLLLLLLSAGMLNVLSALLCYCVAAICACVYTGFLLRDLRTKIAEQHPLPDAAELATDTVRWRQALGPFTGIAAVGYLNTELFVPMVALFGSSEEVAYFKIALSLALLIGMPLALVESVIKPQVTRLYEAADGRRLRQLVSRSGWGALGLSLPILGVFLIYGEPLVRLVYGPTYAAAVAPMIVLGVGFAIVNLVGPSMQLLYATRYEKDALVISLVSLMGVVLGSALLIPTYGALGAASAFAIAKVFRAVAFRFWAASRLHTLLNSGAS